MLIHSRMFPGIAKGVPPIPCRIEITCDVKAQRAYWNKRVNGLTMWKILGTSPRKQEAGEAAAQFAIQVNCGVWPARGNDPGPWDVYYFEYQSDRT